MLFAEVIHHYFPKMVELHNYSNSSSVRQKLYNWGTLNGKLEAAPWRGILLTPPPLAAKVLKRLKFQITKDEMEDVVNCVPGVVEVMLMRLQSKMAEYRQRKAARRTASASGSAGGAASTGGSARGPSEVTPHAGGETYGAGSSLPMQNGHSHSLQSHGGGGAAHADMLTAAAEKDTTIQELSETVEVSAPPSSHFYPPLHPLPILHSSWS